MNVLNVAKTLKGIKINQLEDEFQSRVLQVINPLFPINVNINSETNGDELLKMIDDEVPRELRNDIMNAVIFRGDEIRRFFNDVERCQQDMMRNVEFDDTVKGTFLSHSALLVIIIVFMALAAYVWTPNSRGEVPESKSISLISTIVQALANDSKPEEPVKE